MGFGPLLLASIASFMSGIAAPTKEQKVRAVDQAVREHFGKRKLRRHSDITDPYFGIASRGRQGATARAEMMVEAAPKRAPRKMSNPFKHEVRRKAFSAALAAGALRADAMKAARRVSVPRATTAAT